MKNLFKTTLLSLLVIVAFSSCEDDDDNYYYHYYYSYGNILADEDGIENGYSIILDSGNELLINHNFVADEDVEDGDRVYAQYNILGHTTNLNGKKTYTVDLYGLSQILEKDPVLQSVIDDPDSGITEETIGDDPLKLTNAIVSGKYLTVEFWIFTKRGSSLSHLINVVQDDTRVPSDPGDNAVYLTLRHNGYDEVPASGTDLRQYVKTYGSVSFDITSILPAGETSVPIKIFWTEYGITLDERQQYSIDRIYSYTPDEAIMMQAVGVSGSGGQASNRYIAPYLIN